MSPTSQKILKASKIFPNRLNKLLLKELVQPYSKSRGS